MKLDEPLHYTDTLLTEGAAVANTVQMKLKK